MDRKIIYAGQVPLETDLLGTNKSVLTAIGQVLQDMIGTSTLFSGLGCVPTSPASMTVNINPGRAYSLQVIDAGAYSSLLADSHQIVKQGILLDATNLACPAPTTSGFSINYLIQAAFQEVDTDSTVLPYYNPSNPAQAYSGPNNTGASQNTTRKDNIQLQVKNGVAATTGSQVTPTPDAGFTGLWVVTVAFGATTITSGNITQYSGAPLLTASLLQMIQQGTSNYAVATGTANAHVAAFSPPLTSRTDGMVLRYKSPAANTGALTFNDGLGAVAVVGAAHSALQGGETATNGDVWVQWNSSIGGGSYVMLDSTGGAVQISPATASQHALPLGQATGRLLNVQVWKTHGTFTYTKTPGTTAAYAECQGAGGSGGGTVATGASQCAVGGGGSAGAFGSSYFPTGIASGTSITVGQGGASVSGNNSNPGGSSSIGALMTSPGGLGGSSAGPTTPPWLTGGGAGSSGAATGGNLINASGDGGEVSTALTSSGALVGGKGGASPYGGGAAEKGGNNNGAGAVSPGSGGGGCAAGASQAALSGGAGADGYIAIYEYGTI